MTKNFIAAVVLSAVTVPAAAAVVEDFAAPSANAITSYECLAGADVPCDPSRGESPYDGIAWPVAAQNDTELVKWAVLLLEICAASAVLLRSGGEAQARRSALLRSSSPASESEEDPSAFRAL